jgi:hypothetical protein
MARVGGRLFLSDTLGRIYRVNPVSGLADRIFQSPNGAAALAAHDGWLLVGGLNRTIAFMDPETGGVARTLTAPDPVGAIAVRDGFVYVSGPALSIHRAALVDGVFSYFTCSCFGSVNQLIATEHHLMLVDANGGLWRMNRGDGQIEAAFWLGDPAETLGMAGGSVFVGNMNRELFEVNAEDGHMSDPMIAPVPITSMLVFSECPTDLTGDRRTDLADLSRVIASFGSNRGDVDGDGQTTLSDLAEVLGTFGSECPE